jgi:hypothetical protein
MSGALPCLAAELRAGGRPAAERAAADALRRAGAPSGSSDVITPTSSIF